MRITLNNTLKQKGHSQYWLSHETGIAASTINNLCNGKTTSIKFDTIEKISKTLNCSIDEIFCTDYPK